MTGSWRLSAAVLQQVYPVPSHPSGIQSSHVCAWSVNSGRAGTHRMQHSMHIGTHSSSGDLEQEMAHAWGACMPCIRITHKLVRRASCSTFHFGSELGYTSLEQPESSQESKKKRYIYAMEACNGVNACSWPCAWPCMVSTLLGHVVRAKRT